MREGLADHAMAESVEHEQGHHEPPGQPERRFERLLQRLAEAFMD
jgi:hypothetical protein